MEKRLIVVGYDDHWKPYISSLETRIGKGALALTDSGLECLDLLSKEDAHILLLGRNFHLKKWSDGEENLVYDGESAYHFLKCLHSFNPTKAHQVAMAYLPNPFLNKKDESKLIDELVKAGVGYLWEIPRNSTSHKAHARKFSEGVAEYFKMP